MNLVLDIGNTFTKAGWFECGSLTESERIKAITPERLRETLSRHPVDRVMVSSVGETDRRSFEHAGLEMGNLFFLDHHIKLPVKITYASPETLGRDRIASAAGARYIYPNYPVLVMDLGTAITIDFVSAEGEFRGGNISPGLDTRFKSLHTHTAKLPLVSKDDKYPEFGFDTVSAIAAGVQQGIIHELNGYIALFRDRYTECRFVATGGDAGFFVPKLKKPIFAFPDLVLTGLNHILEYNYPVTRP